MGAHCNPSDNWVQMRLCSVDPRFGMDMSAGHARCLGFTRLTHTHAFKPFEPKAWAPLQNAVVVVIITVIVGWLVANCTQPFARTVARANRFTLIDEIQTGSLKQSHIPSTWGGQTNYAATTRHTQHKCTLIMDIFGAVARGTITPNYNSFISAT